MVKLLFILSIAIIGGSASPDVFYNVEKAEEYFQEFIAQYKKQYISIAEKANKFKLFKESLQKYNKLNLENEHAEFGINEYADLSPGEMPKLKSVYPPLVDVCTIKEAPNATPPDSLDFRNKNMVTRVKNQNPCGSCWAFSAIGNVEGQYAKQYKKLVTFSEQQLMDCVLGPRGCIDGNNEQMAFKYFMDGYGIMAEDDYPYLKDNGQYCAYDPRKVKANVTGCEEYSLSNEYDVMKVLSTRGPLSVSIDATDLMYGGYRRGIMTRCSAYSHQHAVLLVGYGTVNNMSYWIYKNSWGPLWGEDGYFRVKQGINGCGLLSFQITSAVIQ